MSSDFHRDVDAMTLDEVHSVMNLFCTKINSAKGCVSRADDKYIAELRQWSKLLGREITLEIDPSILAYQVKPFRLS